MMAALQTNAAPSNFDSLSRTPTPSYQPLRHAKPIRLSPEVASILPLNGLGSSLQLDGSPVRSKSIKARVTQASISSSNKSTEQPGDDNASSMRASFETDTTLLGALPAKQGTSLSSKEQQQHEKDRQRRQYATPLNVSDDVQAILQGRTRGGGALSLGGEPLRATAKGSITRSNEAKRGNASDKQDTVNSSSSNEANSGKGKKPAKSFFSMLSGNKS